MPIDWMVASVGEDFQHHFHTGGEHTWPVTHWKSISNSWKDAAEWFGDLSYTTVGNLGMAMCLCVLFCFFRMLLLLTCACMCSHVRSYICFHTCLHTRSNCLPLARVAW